MTMVLEDARLALRLMRHNRGFTAATLLTLAAIGLRALKLKDPLHPELWICRGLIWVLEMVTKFTSVMSLTGAEPVRRPVADARVLDGPVARTALPRSLFFGRECQRMRR